MRATALESEQLVVRGERAELRLEGGQITISKQATTQVSPTEVTFPVSAVRGTTIEAPPRGGRGWLHVAVVDGSPAPPTQLAATGDPYTLPITWRASAAAKKLARLVNRHVKERGMPSVGGPNQGQFSSGVVLNPTPRAPSTPQSKPTGARGVGGKATGSVARPSRQTTVTPAAPKTPPASSTAASRGGRADDSQAADSRVELATQLVDQLKELAALHASGALTDEEFAHAKARILGSS